MKVRFVIPWYGENIPGGAESECRQTAENLKQSDIDVEVLTTCAKDAYNWQNHYRPGTYKVNDVTVKRFKVDRRNANRFNQVNLKLMNNTEISEAEEAIFIKEMINSQKLYDYIAANNDGFYLFIPYLFGTTYFGSRIHPDKSFLIPCLHDESYAKLNIFKKMFENVRGAILNTAAEKQLVKTLYNISDDRLHLIGAGVDTDLEYNAERFHKKFNISDNFILYAGRKDIGKNVLLLMDYFYYYKRGGSNNSLKLVLMGSGDIDIPSNLKKNIIDLGYIEKSDKYDAFAAALLHCQPSTNESFSFTLMESWLCGRPVLVHQDCDVTRDHCIQSNGGLYFNNVYEFIESIDFFNKNSDICQKMGENGKAYVKNNYSWSVITQKYKSLLESQNEN